MATRSFVKAIYDYNSSEPGDLTFNAGDVIEVVDIIDDNWINGQINDKVGLFPKNFVEPTSVVSNTEGKTVVARETYVSGEDGVLTFFVGDVITFLEYIDDYWCRGSFAGEVGFFPAFAVDGLDSLLPTKEPDSLVTNVTTPQESPSIKTLQIDLDKPCAESLYEFEGYSDFELSFPAGQIISLTKHVDEEWFEGTYDNKSGIFPKTFVNVLSPLSENAETDTGEEMVPFAIAAYPFVGETRHELSFREGDVIYLHSWVSPEWIEGECDGITGIFPSSFVQIQVELPQDVQASTGYEWEKRNGYEEVSNEPENVSSLKIGDTATAIYSFATNIEGDLALEVGDLITIEGIIDEEWVLGRNNREQVGFCPVVFLELQNDRPTLNVRSQTYTNNSVSPSLELKAVQNLPSKSKILSDKPDKRETILTDSSVSVIKQHGPQNHSPPKTLNLSHINSKTSDNSDKVSDNVMNYSNTVTKTKSAKPPIGPKPAIRPKPEFLKKASKPGLQYKPKPSNTITNSVGGNTLNSQSIKSTGQKKEVVTGRQMTQNSKAMYNAAIQKKHRVQEKSEQSTASPNTSNSGWITFDDSESVKAVEPTLKSETSLTRDMNYQSQPLGTKAETEQLGHHTVSYRTLLDKSLNEELPSPLQPEVPHRAPPNPPPRLDLLKGKSVSDDMLSNKLKQQAEAFETSHNKKSPSLNEMRERNQKSNSQRPVPARRTNIGMGPPSYCGYTDTGGIHSKNGFPILDELDEEIRKLNNELEKETKLLSGVEVVVQMVNMDTPKGEELVSNKAFTEKKIETLKRQLKKIEGQKKRLVKLLVGYTSQTEIKLKIEQLEESIKENVEAKNDLQSSLSENEDPETRSGLQENILFCEKAIANLQLELKSLNDILDQLEGGVVEKTTSEKQTDVKFRKKVIDEILDTEKSFGRDLHLCIDHYKKQLIEWKVDVIDYDVLFGNIAEVASLSNRLLYKLETATYDVDINDQIIGSIFVEFSEEITTVYGTYCRNHDDAIAFLEKSANDETIQQYFSKCLESIREHSSCWDLSSFLIKPVQRILKYPLLLNELLKNTPDDHPDKTGLIKAIDVMSTAANDVNEFKRRKDLVQKYQKVEESGLSTKFQKLTWHSVVKKSKRVNQRLTQFTGFVNQTVDETFNEKERIFYQIEKTIKNFMKNAMQYLEQFEEVHASQVQTAENILDYHQQEDISKEIQEFYDAEKYIGEELFSDLKRVLDEDVFSPLNNMMHLFEGPRRLIQKRHDKCLDYDSWTNKIEKIKDREKLKQAKEELEFAKKNYEALNTQLLDELPVFNDKALVFFQTCIKNFANVHKNFFVNALDQFSPSVQLSAVHPDGCDIVSEFVSRGNLAAHEVFQLTFTPKKNLALPKPGRPVLSPKSGRSSPSLDDKLTIINSLKRSNSDVRKRHSPTSDSGGLVRSQTVSATDRSLKKIPGIRAANPSIIIVGQTGATENMLYVVKYMFVAEGAAELSVDKGDVVSVVDFHDNIGNKEWWRVKHNGKTGYVPAQYLAPQGSAEIRDG